MSQAKEIERVEALRRFKPYPTYKDSGVDWLGEIPAHWEALALKRLVDPARPVTYGIVQCGPDYPGGVPYIRPVDMDDEGGIKADTLQRTTSEIATAYARSTVRPDDVVVSIGPSFGKAMIVPTELDGANLTQGTARVAPGSRITSRFLFWVLRSGSSRQAWDSFCSGATFRALTLEILETCALALPALTEQRAIAAFLDRETARIDSLVAKKERLIDLLQEQRTALITHDVTKGLDPTVPMKDSGVEWLGEIPAHWEVWRMKHVSGGLTVGVVVNPSQYVSPSGVPFLRGVDVSEGRIVLDRVQFMSEDANEFHRKSILRAGDLISIRVGYPGVTAVVPADLDGSNCASLLITRRSSRIDSQLLCYVMNSAVGKAQFKMLQDGAAQEQINVSDAVDFLVPLPPMNEQSAIVQGLSVATSRIDALVTKVHDAIDRLKELRTALISAAVTGKIDVREEVA